MKKWWFIALAFWLTAASYIPTTEHSSPFGALVRAVFVVAGVCWCIIDCKYNPLHERTEDDSPD